MTRVTLGKRPGAGKPPARICEGKAEWPSYSTTTRSLCRERFHFLGNYSEASAANALSIVAFSANKLVCRAIAAIS
ncbi:hypothetical protein ACVWW6_000145 [Bradyrhizobium sp. USDA 3311]